MDITLIVVISTGLGSNMPQLSLLEFSIFKTPEQGIRQRSKGKDLNVLILSYVHYLSPLNYKFLLLSQKSHESRSGYPKTSGSAGNSAEKLFPAPFTRSSDGSISGLAVYCQAIASRRN